MKHKAAKHTESGGGQRHCKRMVCQYFKSERRDSAGWLFCHPVKIAQFFDFSIYCVCSYLVFASYVIDVLRILVHCLRVGLIRLGHGVKYVETSNVRRGRTDLFGVVFGRNLRAFVGNIGQGV